MKRIDNETFYVNYNHSHAMHALFSNLSDLIKTSPVVLKPFRDISADIKDLFSSKGFQLYPTVKKTTLFYDPATNCFFKILHPLNFKTTVRFFFTDKAKTIYNLSEYLCSKGLKIQRVTAYGLLKDGGRPFFAIKKAEGESLYDLMIRGGKKVPIKELLKVLDEVAKLHRLGYWFGDTHLSHIFITEKGVSGMIDIDGIRKNTPFRLKNLAKDIAGLNHPELPLTIDEKRTLLNAYFKILDIKEDRKFIHMLKHYTERRWKD